MNTIITLDQILPHQRSMRWLDRLLHHDENSIAMEAWVREDHLFAEDQGVPSWTGIEYMAQTIAGWAGCNSLKRGESIKIGMLLGTRRYETNASHFLFGQRLQIHAECQLFGDNGLGMFACTIHSEKTLLATASLSVYEPPNADEFLSNIPKNNQTKSVKND